MCWIQETRFIKIDLFRWCKSSRKGHKVLFLCFFLHLTEKCYSPEIFRDLTLVIYHFAIFSLWILCNAQQIKMIIPSPESLRKGCKWKKYLHVENCYYVINLMPKSVVLLKHSSDLKTFFFTKNSAKDKQTYIVAFLVAFCV